MTIIAAKPANVAPTVEPWTANQLTAPKAISAPITNGRLQQTAARTTSRTR